MSASKIAVIGAGPCGLAAVKTLSEAGLSVDCFEAGEQIGGIWNVEAGGGGYRSLQSNTSNPNMAYSDFPFSPEDGIYLTAAEMVDYFNRYATHFGLHDRIELAKRIVSASPAEGGGWRIEFSDGETRDYPTVVIAAGQYASPHRPHEEVPGEFSGDHLHVFDYMDALSPIDMRGKRVVVVGLGTSAAEVASELANPNAPAGCAAEVILSARSGRWVVPKVREGQPMDARAEHVSVRPPRALRALPMAAAEWVTRRMMGKGLRELTASLGGFESLGLPVPDIKPWEDRPTLSFDFLPALREGRIKVRPGLARFAGNTLHFTDGTQAEADVILYATGYDMSFPYLNDDALGCRATDLSLYRHISHPQHDGLFFIGYCRVMCALWPVAEQQSVWLAKVLSGAMELPESSVRKRKAISLRHSLPVMCNMYVEGLRRDMPS
jgi:cation diffusion facilitator CzcD-associated flavoprotein CzcO